MADRPTSGRPVPVPSGRALRLARLGSLATGVFGSVAFNGAREVARGRRPGLRDLVMTPANLHRVTNELAQMRGAAMKIGQLISMDAGEVLPTELAEILGRLRSDAHFMPPRQLKEVLNANWGKDWLREFERFDVRPIAAASIGQVHRAKLRDGRELAIKVQYPGVARSIGSDVANVGALLRLSGFLPQGFDPAPYLDEARAQLAEETDYLREGRHLERFRARLADAPEFEVPAFHEDWSTGEVLAMSFAEGRPIEEAAGESQEARNRIASLLIDLSLRELFIFGEVQSDPNFANYLDQPGTGRIVLLDFGATRVIEPGLAALYRQLLAAGLQGDRDALHDAATGIGFLSPAIAPRHRARIEGMMEMAFAAIRETEVWDFADLTLSRRMQAEGLALAEDGFVPPPVPMDVLYLQRKFGGLFLLASRLGARLPLRELLAPYLQGGGCDPSSARLAAG